MFNLGKTDVFSPWCNAWGSDAMYIRSSLQDYLLQIEFWTQKDTCFIIGVFAKSIKCLQNFCEFATSVMKFLLVALCLLGSVQAKPSRTLGKFKAFWSTAPIQVLIKKHPNY